MVSLKQTLPLLNPPIKNQPRLPQRAKAFEWTERSLDETHGKKDPEAFKHLDALEDQSIYIIREAFKKFGKSAMLWSVGKDSSVLLWLVRKAFFGHIPFDLVHVDTAYKIPQMINFRDRLQKEWGFNLVIGQNRDALLENQTFPDGNATRIACCSSLKKDGLQQVISAHEYDAVFLGIRRDEEGTRAKERYFSPRNTSFQWDFKDQPPELWDQYKTDFEPGTHLRTTNVAERSTRAQDQEAEDAFERLRAEGYM